jgi:hypothetical protein
MVYPPQFLPARSWRAIMAGLNKHLEKSPAWTL